MSGGARARGERLYDLDDSLDSYSRLEAMFSVDGSEALTGSLIEDPSELLRSSAGTARGLNQSAEWLRDVSGGRLPGTAALGPASAGFLGLSGRSTVTTATGSQALGSASALRQSTAFSFGVPAAAAAAPSSAASAGRWRADGDSELQDSVVRTHIQQRLADGTQRWSNHPARVAPVLETLTGQRPCQRPSCAHERTPEIHC